MEKEDKGAGKVVNGLRWRVDDAARRVIGEKRERIRRIWEAFERKEEEEGDAEKRS